uniref:GDE_C domain-containing protein n=1 Tax=Caenorhabditis tropicalis TaxID=1561998 RepID=A0A1I7T2I2_9PELO
MKLNEVKGYFLMADDTVFNIWQRIDFSRVHHLTGVTYDNLTNWWGSEFGLSAANNILESISNNTDENMKKTWERFENGLKIHGYLNNSTVEQEMTNGKGRSISDFFYIPTIESEYFAILMRLFYEKKFFLELAVNKFLKSVNHQTSLAGENSYLWGNRDTWHVSYNKNMVGMHPVKVSQFRLPGENRKRYCESIIQTWSNIMFNDSQDFQIKSDNDTDYKNG